MKSILKDSLSALPILVIISGSYVLGNLVDYLTNNLIFGMLACAIASTILILVVYSRSAA